MTTPLPPIHETAEEQRPRLHAARAAQPHRRLQARYLPQTQHARTRRQGAPRLGVQRDPVGRWLAA